MVEAVGGNAVAVTADGSASLRAEFDRYLSQAAPQFEQAQAVPLPAPWIGPMIRPFPGIRPYPPFPLAPDLRGPERDRFNDPCNRAAGGSHGDWVGFCNSLPSSPLRAQCFSQQFNSPTEKQNWCYEKFGPWDNLAQAPAGQLSIGR